MSSIEQGVRVDNPAGRRDFLDDSRADTKAQSEGATRQEIILKGLKRDLGEIDESALGRSASTLRELAGDSGSARIVVENLARVRGMVAVTKADQTPLGFAGWLDTLSGDGLQLDLKAFQGASVAVNLGLSSFTQEGLKRAWDTHVNHMQSRRH